MLRQLPKRSPEILPSQKIERHQQTYSKSVPETELAGEINLVP